MSSRNDPLLSTERNRSHDGEMWRRKLRIISLIPVLCAEPDQKVSSVLDRQASIFEELADPLHYHSLAIVGMSMDEDDSVDIICFEARFS
jgi:hypothetical protein